MADEEEKSQVTTREPDWAQLLADGAAKRPATVEAVTYHFGPWGSVSAPVCMKCDDGVFRVLKSLHAGGKMLFNDQVVARLAQRIGAPVPEPALVILPDALRAAEPQVRHMKAGVCHGSKFFDKHSDRQGVAHIDLAVNRFRFASLAVLYGWMFAGDHQQIYPNDPPPLVLSVDHGHFIGPGHPDWTIALLEGRGPAHVDHVLESCAALTRPEMTVAVRRLLSVTEADLAADIAVPPDEWGVTLDERTALARYLWRRRADLLQAFGIKADNVAADSGKV